MEEHILTKEEMDSKKALSDINIKISEAQTLLFKLQEEETDYLVGREEKALERIENLLTNSQELIKEAEKNHKSIEQLSNGLTDFVKDLLTLQAHLGEVQEEFEQRNKQWEKRIDKEEKLIADSIESLKIERVKIDNDYKNIEKAKQKLADDQRKLEADRGTLKRAIERLKQGKI